MAGSAAWSGRFSKDTAPLAVRFGASLPFDWRLYRYDIAGSIVHARMLARQGIIGEAVQQTIEQGLRQALRQIEDGSFQWNIDLEDVHLSLEAALGEAGRSLHTARSRNDQVALDVRLYARQAQTELIEAALALQRSLIDCAAAHVDTIMPGYTHLQRAQPISLAHHLLAYVEMLERDVARLSQAFTRTNVLPLGSGALAGVPYPIDRQFTADALAFDTISANSLDAVSDRDFVVETLSSCALCGIHLSRLAEELVLWSSAEFGYVEMDDAWATGSSMMPQKKNPDFAELVRAKMGRLTGALVGLLTVLKGLPLAYNKDLQEDKEPLFDACDTLRTCLDVCAAMIGSARFDAGRMADAAGRGYTTATDLADYLVTKGLPFRQAHQVVGKLVAQAVSAGKQLPELALDELRAHSPLFDQDALHVIQPRASISARDSLGGTAPTQVQHALVEARHRLQQNLAESARLRTISEVVDRLLEPV